MSLPDRLATALSRSYRLERELGQGGMATVYLAEDLKHKRNVALKVLKPELAAVLGAERFVQEITTTAALQHPHILPLFDSGSVYGPDKSGPYMYYVMPFIQGETLRTRLDRETQLGVEEAVRITVNVADALDYAHRQGVVHRDIKPENILLHEGRPMVADFGIALAVSAAAGGRMTETGLSLGTPHYMSPEQATAEKEISARSDVYSLASVLYEMLTGSPPHVGASPQQIIMKIVTEEAAPVTKLRKSVPPNVAAAVAKALEKLPADRFESAKAFAEALGDPGYRRAGTHGEGPAASGRDWRTRVAVPALALAILASVIAAFGAWSEREGRASGITDEIAMSSLMPPADERWLRRGDGIALSPDGRTLAVVVLPSPEAAGYLALRGMDDLATRRLLGTEGARFPFWSPDGQSLGFFAQGQLKRVEITSGAVRSLCAAPGAIGGSWSSTGEIIYAPLINASPWRVPADGGECTDMRLRLASEPVGGRPFFLGDGRHFILTGALRTTLGVSGEDTVSVLTSSFGARAVLALPDFLISPSREGVLVQRIDVSRRQLVGDPARILDAVQTPGGFTTLTASATGSLVVAGPGESVRNLVVLGRRGVTAIDTVPMAGSLWTLRPSRRGDRLVLAGFGIALFDLATRTTTTMPTPPGGTTVSGLPPIWGAGDTTIVLSDLLRAENTLLFGLHGEVWNERWLPDLDSERIAIVSDWSGDGRWLLLGVLPGEGSPHQEIWLRDTRDGAFTALVVEARDVGAARFSPDGRFISHTAMVNDESQVYIRRFPGPGPAIRVSAGEGSSPRWRGDSRELFYTTTDRRVMAVPIGPDGAPGAATVAFENELLRNASEFMAFEMLPDGQGIVLALAVGGSAGFTLVQNWPALMRRRETRP